MDAFPADPCQAGDCGRFLPGHTTAVSVLDRLLHHANVVTDGDSYRMRQARARKGTTLNKT
jgi:DNA replication protein DnaC